MATKTASPAASIEAERRTKHHEADIVVVGAGIFGCAAAFALARQGRSVLLLERWMKEPDRIVGELLQPGGVAALHELGLGDCLKDIDAIPCYGYNVIYHDDSVAIPYPVVETKSGEVVNASGGLRAMEALEDKKKKDDDAGGGRYERPRGWSFHHGRFIMNLRRACLAEPNITVVETEVTATIKGENSPRILGVESRTTVNKETGEKKDDCFFGSLTIIADGYASRFRKQVLPRSIPVVKSKFYALELIDCVLPHQNFGTVVIGQAPSPVLLYQIGTHETRALIDVPTDLPQASPSAGGVRAYIRNTVLPTLPPTVQPSMTAALNRDDKIPRSMPNSWLPAVQQNVDGMVILGDALNMRHPLTGGGMTVAFKDILILSTLLAPSAVPTLTDVVAVNTAISTFYWRRKSHTSIINVLAQALYALFSARGSDRQLSALQRGCFSYFQHGITDGPMGLLAGLITRPLVLAYHFFSVAFLAIGLEAVGVVRESLLGPLMAPMVLWRAVLILWKACVVFLPVFWRELK